MDNKQEENRLYMLWFGKICDDAGSKLGKDRQFLISKAVPDYDENGKLIGEHEEIAMDKDLLPTIGGQVFSGEAAVRIGKYLAKKLGKTVEDIEKELNES